VEGIERIPEQDSISPKGTNACSVLITTFARSVSGLEELQRITDLNIQPKSIAFQVLKQVT